MDAGLVFNGPISKDEWKELGSSLKKLGKGYLWWLGDWMIYGEATFQATPEKRDEDKRQLRRLGHSIAQEIAQITGYSAGFISDVKSVCMRVNMPWRHGNLTLHHAREILANVPDAQFPFWAHRVLTEKLSTREVRVELRKSRRTVAPSPATKRPALFAQEYTAMVRKFMAESSKWSPDEIRVYLKVSEPILRFFKENMEPLR